MTARLPLALAAALLAVPAGALAQDVEIGGELRQRAEAIDAPRFGLGGDRKGDAYVLQRILLRAETRLEPARVVVELGAHEAWGKRGLAPPDEDHLDLQQGYAEFADGGFTIRLGRQEIVLDEAQRFVSYRDGANIRQSYDGTRVAYEHAGTRIDAFLVRPVAIERGLFDDGSDDRQSFGGVYLTRRIGGEAPVTLGGYWLRLGRELPTGTERRDSFGARVAGKRAGWEWDAEGMLQRGRLGSRKIRAWGLSADLGYTLDLPARPRLGLRLDAGSGDDPSDGALGGFHPLFPKGGHFDEAGVTTFTNLVALRASVRLRPTARLSLEAATQGKWRESRDDAVYTLPSVPLAATLGNRARGIGQSYSLDAKWKATDTLAVHAQYVHHQAGDAIRLAGGESVDFAMLSAALRF